MIWQNPYLEDSRLLLEGFTILTTGLDDGKTPLQAVCAVMRKLLHAIHGMLKHGRPFDNTRFYAIQTTAG
jgi:hypothetical protein